MSNEKLYEVIEKYTRKIQILEDIRQGTQKYNGKVFNKKFVDLLESIPDVVATINTIQGIDKYHSLNVWVKSIDRDHQTLIHIYKCENVFLENNRVNFQKFSEYITQKQTDFSEAIAKLQNDIHTGEQRLKEWNELAEKMNKLKITFSSDFVQLHYRDFDSITRP